MKVTTKIALAAAVAGGYLLGRMKKGRLAFAVATYLAGRRFGLDPQQLATEGLKRLSEVPAVAELQEQVRSELMNAAHQALAAPAPSEKTAAEKMPAKEAPAKKTAAKKTAAKKTAAKKMPAKEAPAKKTAAKKAPAKKTAAKKTSPQAKKAPVKKAAAKRSSSRADRSASGRRR
ncbi:histone H1-like repetitive region-containing protein [Streptomyces sp. NBC_00659]|uniref:histone H1-like repetitive region-containing protein n=1 Tax=Streptomyces sp. NBC_00659 TaxID=2903669 RepID=UPI002E362F00|nr:histone H1-like repetitive region-containing protein [Streptomyces sp. NBC_00659]